MIPKPRKQAFQCLTTLLDEGQSLKQLLSVNAVTPPAKNLCFGVCRYYFKLSVIANHLLDKKPKSNAVWVCILMGLYALIYAKEPDYAVVKETVGLLDKTPHQWGKNLVNAVLRRFCRERQTLLASLTTDEHYQNNHPEWFVQHIQEAWPNQWQTILEANDSHPPMHLRVNLQQTTREDYLNRLQKSNIEANALHHTETGIQLHQPCPVDQLPDFQKGIVSLQDEAPQLAISLLDLKPGQRVLDACAAPGGKTAHILEQEPKLERCIALDLDAKRLQRMRENLTRLRLSATLIKGDASHPKDWWDKTPFDRILLDAPCTATGVIRRHPDIKLLRTPEDLQAIVVLQQSILTALWPLLAPQGILLYATCSILPEENEQQIATFVAKNDNCRVISIDATWGEATAHGRQIFPGRSGMDGFFYSKLLKIGN